jgi:hypothetical protein
MSQQAYILCDINSAEYYMFLIKRVYVNVIMLMKMQYTLFVKIVKNYTC